MLGQSLVRQCYPHGSVRRVLRGPIRGVQFIVKPGMAASYALALDCWHHRFLATQIQKGMTVFDVGGNWGQMALFFAHAAGPSGSVYTFEPVPDNVAVLRRNLDLNDFHNVRVMEMALGAAQGKRSFVFDAARPAMGALDGFAAKLPGVKASLAVECDTVDGLIEAGLPVPALIKIDVEGGGGEVLAGARETLRKFRPRIYFELHAADEEVSELQALRCLKNEFGYRITHLTGTHDIPVEPGRDGTVWCEPS